MLSVHFLHEELMVMTFNNLFPFLFFPLKDFAIISAKTLYSLFYFFGVFLGMVLNIHSVKQDNFFKKVF